MPHWPRQQAHALVLRVTMADRRYAGFDLSPLGSELKPDRIVTATDLKRDGIEFPIFYGEDVLLPEGETPAYLGQAVAILIYQDFARFRFAKEKVQFNDAVVRYGEVTGPLQRDPWGSSRFVRVGGKTAHDEDVFSAMKQGPISPSYDNHEPVWPKPARDGDVGAQGMYHANRIDDELAHPPADWLILTRDYATQSGDTAALEPDCANAWYDADKQELHLVVPTQSPQEVAEGAATMLGKSRIGLKRLFLHPCFTVGYGSKDHCIMPYYGLVASLYGDGRPVRLANDRFEQFQTGLKRHQFNMGYTAAVDRRTGLLQSFRANIVANGGGRANCSVVLTMVGATSAQSVYYFPKSDVAATAIASRAIDCGAARGYGALETLTATELMIDEIAAELGLDPIEFRLRNVLKTGMKTAQGAIPLGTQRAEAVLEKARAHALWVGRAARKQAYDAAHPGKYYGVGFGCIQRRFGTGAEASLAKVELAPDGRIKLTHSGTEIGTGASSGQAVACARWLGRPADSLDLAVTQWVDLPVETSGDPDTMSQADQDRLAKNPRWSPAFASASSASNSSYYFSHVTREAARIVFLHGLWPAASRSGRAANKRAALALKSENARWSDGSLTVEGTWSRCRWRGWRRKRMRAASWSARQCTASIAGNGRRLTSRWTALRCACRWTRCRCATVMARREKTRAGDHAQPLSGAGSPRRVFSTDAEQQRDGWLQHRSRHVGRACGRRDQRKGRAADASHHTRMRQHAGAGAGVGPTPRRCRLRYRPCLCMKSCRFTRMVRATAPGISIAITCRAAATSRCGRRPPRSCRRCRTASRRREWPKW